MALLAAWWLGTECSGTHLQQRLGGFVVQFRHQLQVWRLRLQRNDPQLLPQQQQQRQRQLLLPWPLRQQDCMMKPVQDEVDTCCCCTCGL